MSSAEVSGVEPLLGNDLLDFRHNDSMALVSDNAQVIRHTLSCLSVETFRFSMRFLPLECKIFPQDWQDLVVIRWKQPLALSTSGAWSHLVKVLGRKSDPELRKAEQVFGIYDTRGITTTFSSKEWCLVSQLSAFLFEVALFALSALGGFLHSTTDVSEVVLESGGNIGWAVIRCVIVCPV